MFTYRTTLPVPSPRASRAGMLLLAACLALAGCKSASDVPTLLAEAGAYRERGDLAAAVIQLKNAVQQAPQHAQARRLLGELYLESGHAVSAEKELRRARELGADPAKLTLLIGKAMLLQGQYDKVLREIVAGVAAAERPATLALRANAELGLGRADAAHALFEQSLKLHPDATDALLGQARIAFQRNDPAQAATLVTRALGAAPTHVESLRFQGDLLRAQGKPDLALASHARILATRPQNTQAHLDIGHIHLDGAQFDKARAAFAAARKFSGAGVGVLYAEALLAFRENKLPPALDALQQILRSAPDYYPAVLLCGAVQSALGASEQAAQHLHKFLNAYPGHLYASKLMSMLHIGARQPEKALALLTPLLQAHADDVELLALAGEAHLSARRYDSAAGFLQRASALRPQAPELHTALALSRLGSGDTARAVAELERASTLDGASGRTGLLLVLTHLRAGAPERALEVARKLEQQGENPLIHNLKGGIYLTKGDAGNARASFEQALRLDGAYLPALANLADLDRTERKAGAAERRYLAALAKSPDNPALMDALASFALSENKPAQALAWLERVRHAHPARLSSAVRLADLYARHGHATKALALAQQLNAAHPSDAEVMAVLAQAQAVGGQLDAAAASYAKLAVLTPASTLPHMRLASLHLARADHGAALAALRKALALDPSLFEAHFSMLNIYVRQKQFAQAHAVAAALRQRQPKAAGWLKLDADVYSAKGQHAEALKLYEQAFALSASAPLLMQIHAELHKLGRVAEADRRMTSWLAAHPADLPTRLHYASSKLMQNQPRQAIAQFEAVLRQQSDHVVALNDLAWACQQSGDPRALGFAERAFALAPASPAIMDTLGWIHLANGNLARALPLLQKASALAPNAAEIRYHLGVVLARSGDKRAARRELEKSLAAPGQFGQREQARALLATL